MRNAALLTGALVCILTVVALVLGVALNTVMMLIGISSVVFVALIGIIFLSGEKTDNVED